MATKTFKDQTGQILIVKARPYAIIFERPIKENDLLNFNAAVASEFKNYLEKEVNYCWDNFSPKEANSFGSDYEEYYDRLLDSNGNLAIEDYSKDGLLLSTERPNNDFEKCFQFTKRKMESFIYDLNILESKI